MRSLNHLLAATDLSAPSLHAVDRGFLIAKTSGAHFTVMHALGLDALGQLHELLGAQAADASRKIMDETRETLTRIVSDPARNSGISAGIQIEEGIALAAVPSYADAIDADLILVGAHGQGFLQRFLLGSTASRLLRKSRCPVLVVKEACREPYRRALISVDFSPGSERAIHFTKEIAPNADIVLLHVVDIPFEGKLLYAGVSAEVIQQYRIEARGQAMQKLHTMAEAAGLSAAGYTALAVYGEATQQILSHEEKYDCDLLVMGKHGTHVTEELLLGSVTKRVLAESRSDVLVIVDKRAPVGDLSRPQAQ